MKNSEDYKTPARLANAKFEFYSHLTMYVLMNLMLFGLNEIISPSILWFVFPLVGWGAGLFVHGLMVFMPGGVHLKQRLLPEQAGRREHASDQPRSRRLEAKSV